MDFHGMFVPLGLTGLQMAAAIILAVALVLAGARLSLYVGLGIIGFLIIAWDPSIGLKIGIAVGVIVVILRVIRSIYRRIVRKAGRLSSKPVHLFVAVVVGLILGVAPTIVSLAVQL